MLPDSEYVYGGVPKVAVVFRPVTGVLTGNNVFVGHVIAGAALTMSAQSSVAFCLLASDTVSLYQNVPAAVDVPNNCPVDEFNETPLGSVALMKNLNGGAPLLTIGADDVKGTPTSAYDAVQAPNVGFATIVIVHVPDACAPVVASVTVALKYQVLPMRLEELVTVPDTPQPLMDSPTGVPLITHDVVLVAQVQLLVEHPIEEL